MQWRSTLRAQAAVMAILVGALASEAQIPTPVGRYMDALGFTMNEVNNQLAVIYNVRDQLEEAALFVQYLADFENEHAEYPFDTPRSRLDRISRQLAILQALAQVVHKNTGRGGLGLGIYLNVISILNAAALSLGQQHLYIIANNAVPPIDPAIIDKDTIVDMKKGSQYVIDKAALLKFDPDRIYAGAMKVSGGTLDLKTTTAVFGALSTDPDDVKGQAALSATLLTSFIETELELLVCRGGSLRGTDSTVQANTILCGGTVAPGTSIGHLSIDGDFLLEDGLLEIEIGGSAPGQFDVLTVTGAADFQGGTIRFVFTDGFVPTGNDAIEFLTAEGGIIFDPALTTLEFVGTDQGSAFVVVPSAQGLVLQRQETPEEPGTVTVQPPVADVALDQNSPNKNRGAEAIMHVISWDNTVIVKGKPRGGPSNWRTLLRFDLASIPAGATITAASLELCLDKISGDTSTRTYGAHRVLQSWTEHTVTWGTQPSSAPAPTGTARINKGALTTNPDTFIMWNVMADVQAFVNGTANNGWVIRDEQENGGLYKTEWVSKESASTVCGPDSAPRLTVDFTP